jgi:hypothetical protein
MFARVIAVAIVAILAAAFSCPAGAAEPYAAEFEASQVRLPVFRAGDTYMLFVPVWNRGTATWASASGTGGVYLSYHWRAPDGSVVVWDGLRTPLPSPLGPGHVRVLSMSVLAPPPGEYVFELAMVREGSAWFGSLTLPARVYAETFLAALTPASLSPGAPGSRATLSTVVTNIGSATWNSAGPDPVHLAYHWYGLRGDLVVWDGARAALDRDIAPGERLTITMLVILPAMVGLYQLRVDLVREGRFWFADVGSGVATQLEGAPSGLAPQLVDGPDAYSTELRPSETRVFTFRVRNAGTRTWTAAGPNPVRLSYHLYHATGEVAVWDGVRAALPRDVGPGEEVTLDLRLAAPSARGTYIVNYDFVWEGIAWFESVSAKSPLRAAAIVIN